MSGRSKHKYSKNIVRRYFRADALCRVDTSLREISGKRQKGTHQRPEFHADIFLCRLVLWPCLYLPIFMRERLIGRGRRLRKCTELKWRGHIPSLDFKQNRPQFTGSEVREHTNTSRLLSGAEWYQVRRLQSLHDAAVWGRESLLLSWCVSKSEPIWRCTGATWWSQDGSRETDPTWQMCYVTIGHRGHTKLAHQSLAAFQTVGIFHHIETNNTTQGVLTLWLFSRDIVSTQPSWSLTCSHCWNVKRIPVFLVSSPFTSRTLSKSHNKLFFWYDWELSFDVFCLLYI